MSSRTRFLSRLIGLYCILISLSMATHKQATVEAVSTLVQNASLMFLIGVIVLAVGLAMILGHNVWSGGALAVVVTLVGWVSLSKGLLILFLLPQAAPVLLLEAMHYEQFFYLYACISLLLGVYLIYGASRIDPGQA